ncbi:hypothetical protein LX32DRAFT_265501 [Colletotrichum zoysiae]|uniref:Uncharacterized protein n=1 Tax=Colletotrichum zoysiae TaxID=1216348 RepID=A0AAD9H2J3_9PEZI|nr:hypothetical protein LX32DRAFT_265501 [Colletotrichum zoysiae]
MNTSPERSSVEDRDGLRGEWRAPKRIDNYYLAQGEAPLNIATVIGPRPWCQINPSIYLTVGKLTATINAGPVSLDDLSIPRRLEALSGRDSFGSPSDGFPGGVHYDDDAPEERRKLGFRWPTEETRHETRRHSCERAMAFLVRSFRTSTTPTKPEPQQGRYERRGSTTGSRSTRGR